jgi:hypothetical protein
MLCFSNNISDANTFNNFNFIDTDAAFKKSREEIEFLIPEFIKYISGDRTKSKVYGNIKKYYPEELVFINNNILDNEVNDLQNIDTIIEDSCIIYKNLRIVILKENISLTNITGYDILSYTKGDMFINTIFIQDMEIDTRLAFSICLKLFDNIILYNLYKHNVPVFCSKYISLLYNGDNGFNVAKFVIDYFYELLLPFVTKISVEQNEVEELAYQINKSNYEIISEEELVTLYKFINNKYQGITDKFDYLGLILDYQSKLDSIINHLESAHDENDGCID